MRKMNDTELDVAGRWCVLRTGGQRTLALTQSLTDARLAAWTPVAKVRRRLSRKAKRVHYDAPFTPTYVFVREEHLAELNRCLSLPVNPHPPFSIYRPNGSTAYIADRELGPLRAMEERSRHLAEKRQAADERGTAEPYAAGDAVKLDGAFAGLPIKVASSDRRWTEVVVGLGFSLKIDTSHLRRLGVPESPAGMATLHEQLDEHRADGS